MFSYHPRMLARRQTFTLSPSLNIPRQIQHSTACPSSPASLTSSMIWAAQSAGPWRLLGVRSWLLVVVVIQEKEKVGGSSFLEGYKEKGKSSPKKKRQNWKFASHKGNRIEFWRGRKGIEFSCFKGIGIP